LRNYEDINFMDFALPNRLFLALNQGKHLSQMSKFPNIGTDTYFTTHFASAAEHLPHYHEEPHLTFFLNGGAIDKRKNIDAERTFGDFMFFHTGEIHQTIVKTFPTKYVTIPFFEKFFHKNSLNELSLQSAISKNPDLKLTVLKICKETLANDEFSDYSIEMLLLGLINDKNVVEKSYPLWLNKVIELLHDNWNQEISVTDLANVSNVHPKTISKYFPRYFNCTLGEYRRKLKVEKSLSLIKSSDLSLTDIAYECGFYDQSHFTGTFKQLTGFRPKEFQKI
jgi:AraC family transcriptional regulator